MLSGPSVPGSRALPVIFLEKLLKIVLCSFERLAVSAAFSFKR